MINVLFLYQIFGIKISSISLWSYNKAFKLTTVSKFGVAILLQRFSTVMVAM